MRENVTRIVVTLAVLTLLAAGWVVRAGDARGAPPLVDPVAADLALRDVQIAAWEKALAADSTSAIALTQLAGLHMQRGRETGNESSFLEAERYARLSVSERTDRNGAAFVTLASALLSQHRFAEADSIIALLVARESDVPEYRSMLGEIKLELGDYTAAEQLFKSLLPYRSHLSTASRLSRWMEIRGETPAARRILRAALEEAKRRRDIPREQLAWFHLRSGDLDRRHGRLRAARSAFREGLRIAPGDHRLLAAMATLESMENRPRKAIEYGELAMAKKLEPSTLAVIADAYAAAGDETQMKRYARSMELAVSAQSTVFHRAWSLFLLDHGLRVPDVLAMAERELETRRDVYGYDVLAWALHKSGRNVEAQAAMENALRMGTRDASLFYHAGIIAEAAGDSVRAREFLRSALDVNPRFHPVHAPHARALIARRRA